jgi:RHS repeat-associated protein
MRIQPSHNQSFTCPYSFQAQEHDDEVKGDGNSMNYKYRMHDPRLGRFFAVDPLFKDYPWNSSYAFSENKVIHAIELEGLESFALFTNVAGLFKAVFNSSSIRHGSTPEIVFVCENSDGLQFLVKRKMTTGEIAVNKNLINKVTKIAANQTDNSRKVGNYFARATPVDGELEVNLAVGSPNTVTNDVNGSCGYTGAESINLAIASAADKGTIVFNHYGKYINDFSVSDQNGNPIPFTFDSDKGGKKIKGGGFTEGVVSFDIPKGTTSINLTVNGLPDRKSGNGDQRVSVDRWNALITTSGPTNLSGTPDSYSTSLDKAVQQSTNGVSVDKTNAPTSLSDPINK